MIISPNCTTTQYISDKCENVIDDVQFDGIDSFEFPDVGDIKTIKYLLDSEVDDDIDLAFDIAIENLQDGNLCHSYNLSNLIEKQWSFMEYSRKIRIQRNYNSLILCLLSLSSKKDVDYHFQLRIYLCGLTVFESSVDPNHSGYLDREDIMKILINFFIVWFTQKHEIFSCGCIQRSIFKLYENGDVFCRLLSEVFKKLTNGNPILNKYKYLIEPRIGVCDCFEFYCEIIVEFVKCNFIDDGSMELCNKRLPHMLCLLAEIESKYFLKSCRFAITVLETVQDDGDINRRKALYRKMLFPKCFSVLSEFPITPLDESNINQWISIITRRSTDVPIESYLIIKLLKIITKDSKTSPILNDALSDLLGKLKLNWDITLVLYIIDLSFNLKDQSTIIQNVLRLIESSFESCTTMQKESILLIIDLLNEMGNNNKEIANLIQNGSFKESLFSKLDVSLPENRSLLISNITKMNENEFNNLSTLLLNYHDEIPLNEWSRVFKGCVKMNFISSNHRMWLLAIKNSNIDKSSLDYICLTIRLLTDSGDKVQLKKRLEEIFNFIIEMDGTNVYKKLLDYTSLMIHLFELVLSVKTLEIVQTTLSGIWNYLFQFYIILFILRNDDPRIKTLSANFYKRLNLISENMGVIDEGEPLEVIKLLCMITKNQRHRVGWFNGKENWTKLIINLLQNQSKDCNETNSERKRALSVTCIVFSQLSSEMFNKGSKPAFLKALAEACKMLKGYVGTTNELEWELIVELCKGFAMYRRDWNAIYFVRARLFEVLDAVGSVDELRLKILLGVLMDNTELCEAMQKEEKWRKYQQL